MKNFHGWKKKNSYFEGWYLKHQQKKKMIAFIPAYHIDCYGKASASIQIITENKTWMVTYPAEEFQVAPDMFWVKIGDNLFTKKGIRIAIKEEGLLIKGKICYKRLQPPTGDIMGPFKFVPRMQCNHGVLSLYHEISGVLWLNGEKLDFTSGKGYIEKDWGSSFPETYCWSQCNWGGRHPGCVMAAAAKIPFGKKAFQGCIAVARQGGREYRFATYLGARVQSSNEKEIIIKQGYYRLKISHLGQRAYKLQAPERGEMSRAVSESPVSSVKYQLWKKNRILFEYRSRDAAFESAVTSQVS